MGVIVKKFLVYMLSVLAVVSVVAFLNIIKPYTFGVGLGTFILMCIGYHAIFSKIWETIFLEIK